MIRRIEIENFRGVRKMAVDLREFQVLVGANGSGKSTLLDALEFVGDFMRDGLDAAFAARTNNPETLFFGKQLGKMSITIDFHLGSHQSLGYSQLKINEFKFGRYLLEISLETPYLASLTKEKFVIANDPIMLEEENQDYLLDWLETPEKMSPSPEMLVFVYKPPHLRWGKDQANYQLQGTKSALGYAVHEEILRLFNYVIYPFINHTELYHLSSEHLRNPSPPGKGALARPNGSSLPWQVHDLITHYPPHFGSWLNHVRTAIPDIENVRVVIREEDRHAYLMVRWKNGLELPSWSVSEGTLRLLALTVLGYHPYLGELTMVEEPENGIHPQALETVVQALRYSPGKQILITSHSPLVINMLQPDDLLCFASSADNGVTAIAGNVHPRLLNWKKSVSLGNIFATGILAIQS
jgi:predicted ATPase